MHKQYPDPRLLTALLMAAFAVGSHEFLRFGPDHRFEIGQPITVPQAEHYEESPELLSAAMLVGVPAGESPAGGTCPVATVAIPGGRKGDRPAESPGVKVSVGRGWSLVGSAKGGEQLDRSQRKRTGEAPKAGSHLKRMVGDWECRALSGGAKAMVVGEGTGCRQPTDSPGSERATCREGTISESTEPLVSRLVRKEQRRHRV